MPADLSAHALCHFLTHTHTQCTTLQPEVAHVGLYSSDLDSQGVKYDTFMLELKDVDRAVLDRETDGQWQQYAWQNLTCEMIPRIAFF